MLQRCEHARQGNQPAWCGLVPRFIGSSALPNHRTTFGQSAVGLSTLALAMEATVSLSPPAASVPSSPPPRRAGRATASARRLAAVAAAALAAATGLVLASGPLPADAASGTTASATTAWHDGTFALDPDGMVSRD